MSKAKSPKGKASGRAQTAKQDRLRAVRDLFAAWGRQGGKTRARKLSPERKQEIAKRAAQVRWAKAKKER